MCNSTSMYLILNCCSTNVKITNLAHEMIWSASYTNHDSNILNYDYSLGVSRGLHIYLLNALAQPPVSEVATASFTDVVSDVILFVPECLLHSFAYLRASYLPLPSHVYYDYSDVGSVISFCCFEWLINSTVFCIFTEPILCRPSSLLAHFASSSQSAFASNTWSQQVIADLYLVLLHHYHSIPFHSIPFQSIPLFQSTESKHPFESGVDNRWTGLLDWTYFHEKHRLRVPKTRYEEPQ